MLYVPVASPGFPLGCTGVGREDQSLRRCSEPVVPVRGLPALLRVQRYHLAERCVQRRSTSNTASLVSFHHVVHLMAPAGICRHFRLSIISGIPFIIVNYLCQVRCINTVVLLYPAYHLSHTRYRVFFCQLSFFFVILIEPPSAMFNFRGVCTLMLGVFALFLSNTGRVHAPHRRSGSGWSEVTPDTPFPFHSHYSMDPPPPPGGGGKTHRTTLAATQTRVELTRWENVNCTRRNGIC